LAWWKKSAISNFPRNCELATLQRCVKRGRRTKGETQTKNGVTGEKGERHKKEETFPGNPKRGERIRAELKVGVCSQQKPRGEKMHEKKRPPPVACGISLIGKKNSASERGGFTLQKTGEKYQRDGDSGDERGPIKKPCAGR